MQTFFSVLLIAVALINIAFIALNNADRRHLKQQRRRYLEMLHSTEEVIDKAIKIIDEANIQTRKARIEQRKAKRVLVNQRPHYRDKQKLRLYNDIMLIMSEHRSDIHSLKTDRDARAVAKIHETIERGSSQ